MKTHFTFIVVGMALLFLAVAARATIQVEAIDINATVPYTLNDLRIDVNLSTTETKSVILQIYDNNTFKSEQAFVLDSADGNKQYFIKEFVFRFTEGVHWIDANVLDENHNTLALGSTSFNVLANPIDIEEGLSQKLIQQYVLPIARSLSECLVEKADLNVAVTQAHATMKALENDVGIAEADKIAAEEMLSNKVKEVESCYSAKSTCESDKVVVEGKLINEQNVCDNKTAQLKAEEKEDCEDKINLREESIFQRDTRILEINQQKNDMELIAFTFGALFFIFCGLIAFLYSQGRIK